jgi:hypothetical protein
MNKKLYSVYDRTGEIFEPPFVESTDGMAIRMIQTLVANNPQHPIARFGDDFILYKIGEYNPESGMITAVKHQPIMELKEVGEV